MKFIIIFNIEKLLSKCYLLLIGAILIFAYMYENGYQEYNVEEHLLIIGSSQLMRSNIEYLIYIYFSIVTFVGVIYIIHNMKVICYDQILVRLSVRKFYSCQIITAFVYIILLVLFKYLISCLGYVSLGVGLNILPLLKLFIIEVLYLILISSTFMLIYTYIGLYSFLGLISYYLLYFNKKTVSSELFSIQFYQTDSNILIIGILLLLLFLFVYAFSRVLHNKLIEKENFYEHNWSS